MLEDATPAPAAPETPDTAPVPPSPMPSDAPDASAGRPQLLPVNYFTPRKG
jgi:hypothetical protein